VGDWETWGLGDWETGRLGDWETGRVGEMERNVGEVFSYTTRLDHYNI
jgi:hypothetical protein